MPTHADMSRRILLFISLATLAGCMAAPQSGRSVLPARTPVLDPAAALEAPQNAGSNRVARASSSDSWLQLLAEYARGREDAGEDAEGGGGDWFPRPIPISLPIGSGRGKSQASLPVLIVPVPVPVPTTPKKTTTQCSADGPKPESAANEEINYASQKFHNDQNQYPTPSGRPTPGDFQNQAKLLDYLSYTERVPSAPSREASSRDRLDPAVVSAPPTPQAPRPFAGPYEEPTVPHLDYIESSQQLVELFKAQVAPSPELPPAVIPDYTAGQEPLETFTGDSAEAQPPPPLPYPSTRRSRQVRVRSYQLPTTQFQVGRVEPPAPFSLAPSPDGGSPPVPRFDRSLMLRGELTVPRAGYTEPYTVWWDASSGAARVDLHGGATSTYRMMSPDGLVQGLEMRLDRSGEREVRRCAMSRPHPVVPDDRAPPALPAPPDLRHFSFAGYTEAEFGRVERWKRTVSGQAGEMGAARGEALTFRHELLVVRAPDNYTATPLEYSVRVDSSVLGAECDGHVHRYVELRDQRHDPTLLALDVGEACEEVEQGASRDRVEPLREFTLPHRDPRYDDHYQRFKTDHRRQYLDDTEESVRKNVMIQHSRFVNSGNRQGATFNMEVNHLGDRLDEELAVLRGVREEAAGGASAGEQFPHSRDQVAAMRAKLPRHFDWRDRGAVTHVRNQGSCSSCWAFAVTGAVEGALFVRTRRLVPLSEQCLVDCAHPYGGRGCGGTWPSAAYGYVRDRGHPALLEYTPYQEKVLRCVDERVPPVTHISSHVNVTSNSVQALKVAIRRHAPTVVIIDSTAKSFVFYKTGVINDERCAKNKAEHAVLGVGWGEQRSETHFIVKNSWSSVWGEQGFARLAAAPNTCGVLSRPSYPRLERRDVRRIPQSATD